MELPHKNRVCAFCKWSQNHTSGIVWCTNAKAANKRRQEKYGIKAVNSVTGESRFSFSYCEVFEAREGAAQEVIKLKLTDKYIRREHERRPSYATRSG